MLLHVRVLDCVPAPQDFVHSVNGPQDDQVPSFDVKAETKWTLKLEPENIFK